jgi:hypothetical protein
MGVAVGLALTLVLGLLLALAPAAAGDETTDAAPYETAALRKAARPRRAGSGGV